MPDFYEKNYEEYFQTTVGIDPSSFLTPLTGFLNCGATILDIGCGSGRDLLWLRQHGFSPTGFERSPGLAKLAEQYSSCPVIEGDFQNYDFSTLSFDALISIGSLVHLKHSDFSSIINRLVGSLKNNGLILITVKEGNRIGHTEDRRIFTPWRQDHLERIFNAHQLPVLTFNRDISAINSSDVWLSYLLLKRGS